MARSTWHILLIDDNPDDCADLRQMLLRGGSRRYRFSEARLGAEGVRRVLEPQTEPVHCVLLDYDLPDMNARSVLAALCNGTGLPPCPVVVVTGAATEEGLHLLGAGAQDYIGKRWTNADSLTRAVENAVERFALLTERQRVERALVAAKAEADAANRAKSEFLLSMSHELRSPLSAMLGYTQLIEAGTPTPTPAQQHSVEQILSAGWYLLGLINEILDLSSIESGKTVLSSRAVSLPGVLDDCQAMVEPQAQAAGIRLVFQRSQACGFVRADPTRTKQVLVNLLSNAIKYNRRPGQVTVSCAMTAERRVRVSVEDTGPGLSAAQMAQLFQPFNRLGKESGTEPGTGIGLVICKRLVERMGGTIGVDSKPGAGSCFWFELDAAPPPVDDRVAPKHTVLYIEEDASCLLRLEMLMAQRPSACLLRARDIHAGIKMARSARPAAILIGLCLSDPSGLQAMQLLARDPSTTHIPVIALGADATPHDAQAGLAAGFSGFLTQPLRSEPFAEALDLAFQQSLAAGQRAGALENL